MYSLDDLIRRNRELQRRFDPEAVLVPAFPLPSFNLAALEFGARLLSHTAAEFPPSPGGEAGDGAGIEWVCPESAVLPHSLSKYGKIENLGNPALWSGGGGGGRRGCDDDSVGVRPPTRSRRLRTDNRDKTHGERQLEVFAAFAEHRERDREEELRSRPGRDALYCREAQAVRDVLLDELRGRMVADHLCCIAAAQNEAGDPAALLNFSPGGGTVELIHPVGRLELQLPVAICSLCTETVTACAAQIGCFSTRTAVLETELWWSLKVLNLHTSLGASGVSFDGVSPSPPPFGTADAASSPQQRLQRRFFSAWV